MLYLLNLPATYCKFLLTSVIKCLEGLSENISAHRVVTLNKAIVSSTNAKN